MTYGGGNKFSCYIQLACLLCSVHCIVELYSSGSPLLDSEKSSHKKVFPLVIEHFYWLTLLVIPGVGNNKYIIVRCIPRGIHPSHSLLRVTIRTVSTRDPRARLAFEMCQTHSILASNLKASRESENLLLCTHSPHHSRTLKLLRLLLLEVWGR